MAIRVLPPDLAAKIAAGEVIERPASAVKELIENALDAKSETIDVEIEDGGIARITVRDDGEGMSDDDLRLCTARHATSKLRRDSDLLSIHTLGFRGEALASLAAVAHLSIVTRLQTAKDGFRLDVGPGVEPTLAPAGRAPGTTVDVRRLFASFPARSKFLGTPRTESFHVGRCVHRLAVATPDVGWSLRHGTRWMLRAPAVRDPRERLAQIYGPETARELIPFALTRSGIEVEGLAGPPELRRSHRRDQLFIVNGRPVSDRGLSYVVGSAYHGMLRRGTYPLVLIHVRVPPETVDVNVHPRKDEIRFREPRVVQETVSAALQQALASRYAVPHLASASVAEPRPAGTTPRRSPPSRERLPLDFDRLSQASREEKAGEKVSPAGSRRAIGQLRETYLLVEGPDGLEIVDQHVAHEQILHVRLQRQYTDGDLPRQQFLLPVRVELPFDDAERIIAHRNHLERLGVVLDEFGGGTFLLREYPAALAEQQTRYGFQEAIDRLVEALAHGQSGEQALLGRLLASLACAAAVTAGTSLSRIEQQALVDALMTLEDPYRCPHGRPIILRFDDDELARRFGRR